MFKHISFQSVPVQDQQRALEFYRDKMNMTVETDAPYGEDYRWIFLKIQGADTMVHFARQSEVTYSDIPVLCLVTDDVDAEAARLSAAGVEILNGPDDAPWQPGMRWAMIRDSEGNLILMQSTVQEGS